MANPTPYTAVLDNRVPLKVSVHVENFGWFNDIEDFQISGTVGGSLRMEAFSIKIDRTKTNLTTKQLSLEYSAIVETVESADPNQLHNVKYDGVNDREGVYAPTPYIEEGLVCGSVGSGRRIIDLSIKLTGTLARDYILLYRSHQQVNGDTQWMEACYSGNNSYPTQDRNKRLESLWIYCYPRKLV